MRRNHTGAWSVIAALAFAAAAATAAPKTMKTTLNATDHHFLETAVMANMSEVQLGHLALKKSSNDQVKKFAQYMINDHSRANGKFVRTAGRKHVVPPKTVGAENLKTYKALSALNGDKFDRAFMQDMVKDHTKDVAEFQKATRTVKDPDLKALAKETLPVLQQHLQMAKQIEQSVTNGK